MEQALVQIQRAFLVLYAFILDLAKDATSQYRKFTNVTRKMVWAGVVLSAALVGYLVLRPASVDVHLNVRYPFRSAQIAVTLDGDNAYSGQLTGQAKKRLLVMDRVSGSFSKTFAVRPGSHTVTVHIRSEAYAYDQTVQRTFEAPAGRGGTLVVTALNGADLAMNWLPVPALGDDGHNTALLTTVNSLLLTALGTVLSATVGFFVQEFLKSRRQIPLPAAASATSQIPATR